MYEFISHNGERVSVRSARTLGALLSDGSIKGKTLFRRAEEPAYVPAATHAELGRIARDAGIVLAAPTVSAPLPRSAPTLPETLAPEPASLDSAASRPAIVPAPLPTDRDPAIVDISSRAREIRPVQVRPPPLTATPTGSRPPPPSALALAIQRHRAGWRVLVVIAHYLGMATASIAGGAVAGSITGSAVGGRLSAMIVFLAAAHGAGRLLATRRDVPPGWEALLAIILVCAVATAVGGFGGLILSVLSGAILWRALNPPRILRA